MISALHLIWIIPVSASFGCVVAAILAAGRSFDPKEKEMNNNDQS